MKLNLSFFVRKSSAKFKEILEAIEKASAIVEEVREDKYAVYDCVILRISVNPEHIPDIAGITSDYLEDLNPYYTDIVETSIDELCTFVYFDDYELYPDGSREYVMLPTSNVQFTYLSDLIIAEVCQYLQENGIECSVFEGDAVGSDYIVFDSYSEYEKAKEILEDCA